MTRIGKYELLSFLGEGATAEVHHARDTVLGREVALKLLKPSLVTDPSSFSRFMQEARAAAILFHPYIATVFEMDQAEGRYFIAMRYIAGHSLRDWLDKNGPLSWDETLKMLTQVGSALDYAHGEGFLHRDVKPGNILRSAKGEYILTDFGLTRAMMATGLTSHTGAILGTPAYIAPEIWEGKEAVPATDQYALACVVYEMLTGKVLFEGNTPPAIMTAHMLHGPKLPDMWPADVPNTLTKTLLKAFSREADKRYANVNALLADLTSKQAEPIIQEKIETETPFAQVQKERMEQKPPAEQEIAVPKKSITPQPEQKKTPIFIPGVHKKPGNRKGTILAVGTLGFLGVGATGILLLIIAFSVFNNRNAPTQTYYEPTDIPQEVVGYPSATFIPHPTPTDKPKVTNTPAPTITATTTSTEMVIAQTAIDLISTITLKPDEPQITATSAVDSFWVTFTNNYPFSVGFYYLDPWNYITEIAAHSTRTFSIQIEGTYCILTGSAVNNHKIREKDKCHTVNGPTTIIVGPK